MVDEALGGLPGGRAARAHLARGHRRGGRARDRSGDRLRRRGGRPLHQPHRQRRRPRSGRRRNRPQRRDADSRSRRRPASRSRRTSCATTSRRRSTTRSRARSRPTVEEVKPEVTTAEVAEKYPTYIVVNRSNFTLTLYDEPEADRRVHGRDRRSRLRHAGRRVRDPEQAGRPGLERPRLRLGGLAGRHDLPPGPDNPLKARWMGIYDGAGIHGTDDVGSLGSAASHGCVRMAVRRRDRPLRPRGRRHPHLHRLRRRAHDRWRGQGGPAPGANTAPHGRRSRDPARLGGRDRGLRERAAHPATRRRTRSAPTASTCASSPLGRPAPAIADPAKVVLPPAARASPRRSGGRDLERSTVARKLPPTRGLFEHLARTGSAAQNPAELLPNPRSESRLPRVLDRDEVRTLLERIPAVDAARGARPGDARARLLLRPALRGAGRARPAARSTSKPRPSGCSARAARSGSCRWASRRSGPSPSYIERARPALVAGARSERCSSRRAAAACRPRT